MNTFSDKALRFLSRKPTLIGIVMGFKFYEHPDLGDETFLVMITPSGKVKMTRFWELPEVEDVLQLLKD